jgi:alkylation response protein AidB-like acyl-CoA dehydrogenase
MDFDLDEEQRLIRETARDFATEVLGPTAADLDARAHHVGGDIARAAFLANLRRLAELGFMGLNVREEWGGTEAGVVAFSLAITEIARACASTAVTVSVTNMVCEVIQAIGSEEQKRAYIPKLCSGEFAAGSFALTESGAGSDPASMSTRARDDGDSWVLDGDKIFISSAPYAGLFVVWAVTDPEAPQSKGISCFLVEAGSPGLVVGPEERKMGQRGSATCELRFESCRIPKTALMGKLNGGYHTAVSELGGGRIGIGSLALGIGLAGMDLAARYATERSQFGRKISGFEGIQWMIADSYTGLEAARLLLLQAAFLKEKGRAFAKEASMAKLFATEAANRACYDAIQIFGGYGYTEDFGLERLARDVRVTTIYEGTSEIQRVIIAREILQAFK